MLASISAVGVPGGKAQLAGTFMLRRESLYNRSPFVLGGPLRPDRGCGGLLYFPVWGGQVLLRGSLTGVVLVVPTCGGRAAAGVVFAGVSFFAAAFLGVLLLRRGSESCSDSAENGSDRKGSCFSSSSSESLNGGRSSSFESRTESASGNEIDYKRWPINTSHIYVN